MYFCHTQLVVRLLAHLMTNWHSEYVNCREMYVHPSLFLCITGSDFSTTFGAKHLSLPRPVWSSIACSVHRSTYFKSNALPRNRDVLTHYNILYQKHQATVKSPCLLFGTHFIGRHAHAAKECQRTEFVADLLITHATLLYMHMNDTQTQPTTPSHWRWRIIPQHMPDG